MNTQKTLLRTKILLVLCALFTCIPSCFAYDLEIDGVRYTITSTIDLTVRVDGHSNKSLEKLIIPKSIEYKGKTLTVCSVADKAFYEYYSLKSVVLPETILSIGDYAFSSCKKLEDIILPETILSIGKYAFSSCTVLKNIILPKHLSSLGDGVFYGCTSLEKITIPEGISTIPEDIFRGCSKLASFEFGSNVRHIGSWAFAESGIRAINIPPSIDEIPARCFMDCKKLEDITLHASIIGFEAFKGCKSLKTIKLPDNLRKIDSYAFWCCSSLVEFSIPSNVNYIHPTIIWGCPLIKSLKIGKGLNGLPITFFQDSYRRKLSTLGNDLVDTGGGYYGDDHLTGVKEIIIEDTDKTFDINCFFTNKGEAIPAFANLDIDYFYVGRPLSNIKSWKYAPNYATVYVRVEQGYGHISKLEIAGNCTEVPYFYQKVDTLVLGAAINRFDVENLYIGSLKRIVCNSTTPPNLYNMSNIPALVYTDVVVCVPEGCKEAYSNANGWCNFWNIEEMECSSGVDFISTDNSTSPQFKIYDLKGLLIKENCTASDIDKLPKGVYIIVSDKKSLKIKI